MNRDVVPVAEIDPALLKQRLKGFQIFFIILSVIIGSGVFSYNGQALKIAGPMGLVLAVVLQGLLAALVGETVSELVQIFPAPNALYAYVETFVDEDLGWVAALSHWYCFASVVPAQMLGAQTLLSYWNPSEYLGKLIFYGITPWVLLALNLCGVDYFGWVETVGGALKLAFAFTVACVLFNISQENGYGSGPESPINDGFQANMDFSSNAFRAFCLAMPPVAYGFLGVEATTIAAYEARSLKSIARPSQTIHWAVLFFYFLCTFGIALIVDWEDHCLPTIWSFTTPQNNIDSTKDCPSTSATVFSVLGRNQNLAGFLNAGLIFSVLSSGNTCLYIGSRTLYGLTYHLRGTNKWSRYFKRTVGKVWPSTSVPAMALFVSVLAFYWIPFLTLADINQPTVNDVIEVVTLTASVSCLITWMLLLIAYLRYEKWTRSCSDGLKAHGLERFVRDDPSYQAWNVLAWLQPWTARFALAGCLFNFICLSATWWDAQATFAKVAAAYGAHFIFFTFWACLKIYKRQWNWRQWYVPMAIEPRPRDLMRRLRHLERLSVKGGDRTKPRGASTSQVLGGQETIEVQDSRQENGHPYGPRD